METRHITITADDIRSGKTDAAGAVEPLTLGVSLGSFEGFISDIAVFTAEQTNVFALLAYLRLTAEGGHEKFFFEPEGMVWLSVVMGLRDMGEDELADSLLDIRDKFPACTVPYDLGSRINAVCENGIEFSKEDALLESCRDELSKHIEDYVREYAEQFEFDGDIDIF